MTVTKLLKYLLVQDCRQRCSGAETPDSRIVVLHPSAHLSASDIAHKLETEEKTLTPQIDQVWG